MTIKQYIKDNFTKNEWKWAFGFVLIMTIMLLSMNFVSADVSIGSVRQDNSIQLTQTCSNCTYVNLTSILDPTNNYLLLGQFEMTKNGSNFNYTTTAPPTDSCTCTPGSSWTIINGNQCTLSTTCNLGTGILRILDGALRIDSSGALNAQGCYIQTGEALFVINGGKLICR